MPALGWWLLCRKWRGRLRIPCLLLLVLPGILLARASWMIHGRPFPILENLRASGHASLWDVPWLRDAWAVAKTFVWVSGATALVFPNGIYLIAITTLAAGLYSTLRNVREEPGRLILLGIPVVLFVLALGYHSWLITATYGPGGTVGWYLWAAALPLSLLMTWGIAGSAGTRRLLPLALGFFLVLTFVADVVQALSVTGALVTTSNRHLVGFRPAPIGSLAKSFLSSRPAAVGVAAPVFAAISWLLGAATVSRCRERFKPRAT